MFLVGQVGAGLNREHDVLVFPVVRVDVMGVVSGDEAQVVFFPELEEGFVEFLDFGDVVLLELEEEAVAAEAFKIPFDFGAGVGEIAAFDRARYFRLIFLFKIWFIGLEISTSLLW